MLGLIELLIVVAVIVLIFLFLKKSGLPKSRQSSKSSRFKRVSFISTGIILVGIVLIKSLISINSDRKIEEFTAKISAPAMKLEGSIKSQRTLVQILFVNVDNQSLIYFDENVHDGGINKCSGEFNFKGFEVYYSVHLIAQLINSRDSYFQGTHTFSMRSALHSSSSSGTFYFEVKQGYDKLFQRNQVKGAEGFFELSRNNHERIAAYLVCHRLHPDDELKTISKEELFGKINLSKDVDKGHNISTSSDLPFVELIKVLGASCIILIFGSALIAFGIEKNYAFPAVLLVVIFSVIGIKKYEYFGYESIALDQGKSHHERKMAVINAKAMSLFKVSANDLEKKLWDL